MTAIRLTLIVTAVIVTTGSGSTGAARVDTDRSIQSKRGPVPANATEAHAVTFAKDVAPILFERCGGCHHPGGVAPFSLLTYASARQRATQIGAVTRTRYMPPWKSEPRDGEFVGQRHLTDAEIDILQRWVDAGAPEGNPDDQPPVPQWPAEWQLGHPDLVVRPSAPYVLPAGGTDAFHLFVIPIPVDTRRYVAGIEFRPENHHVVHHANIMVDPTPFSRERNAQNPALGEEGLVPGTATYPPGHLLGWTPGQPDPLLPKGLAWPLNPGTDLVVQLHLQPSGTPESVQFSVGLFFSPDPPDRTPAVLRLGRQNIDIRPGDQRYVIRDSYVLPVNVEVLATKPHAHFRAREVKGWATRPDGTTQSLIHIRDWDFRWQHVYRFVTPPVLPKGTILQMEYTYDNSADNPRNPQQPPQRVRWGPHSFDEMGDLWIQVLPRDVRGLEALNRDFQLKRATEDVAGYEVLLDRDPGNVALRHDAARLYLELGRPRDAITHYEMLLRLHPELASAHFNLGVALDLSGMREQAVTRYEEALRIQPDYAAARNNLGNALFAQGRFDAALVQYREVLRLEPRHAGARNNIGLILMTQGRLQEAISLFQDALRLDSESPDTHHNIGLAFQKRGQLSDAARHLRRAVDIRGDSAPILADLAWLLATAPDDSVRDPQEAIRMAERATRLTNRRDTFTLDALAAAYAAAGRFDSAVAAVQEAISLGPPAPLLGKMIARQRLYRAEQPYREPGGSQR
jgi:tetratricopeptide (TPR) repeat protein